MGDAICQLDPCFGQGMTVALQQAQLLAAALRRFEISRLPRAFYRAANALVEAAWMPSASENFRRPGMSGDRPAGLRGIQWYSGHALDLADRDADAHRALQGRPPHDRRPTSITARRHVGQGARTCAAARPGEGSSLLGHATSSRCSVRSR